MRHYSRNPGPQKSNVPMATEKQKQALRILADAIVDAVKAGGPLGASSDIVFASLQHLPNSKITVDYYNRIMAALVNAGRLRQEGDLYFVTGRIDID